MLRAVLLLQTNSLCKRNKGYQGYRKYKLDSDKETREGKAREKGKRKGRFCKQRDGQAMFLKVCHGKSVIFSTLPFFSFSTFHSIVQYLSFLMPLRLSCYLTVCMCIRLRACVCVYLCQCGDRVTQKRQR